MALNLPYIGNHLHVKRNLFRHSITIMSRNFEPRARNWLQVEPTILEIP